MAIKILAYISPVYPEPPCGRICIKFCTGGRLTDIINRAKFYLGQVRGFDSVGGQIFGFPRGKRSCR